MRLSPWFWRRLKLIFGITVLTFVCLRCAKDASLTVTKVDTKRLTVELVASGSDVSPDTNIVSSNPNAILLSGKGRASVDFPAGQTISLQVHLEKGWEVVGWETSLAGNSKDGGKNRSLQITKIDDDQRVQVKIRKVPFLQFAVKVSGKGYGGIGGGSVNWTMYLPGNTNGFGDDSGWCNTINGYTDENPRVCDQKNSSSTPKYPDGYPNGSRIVMEVETRPGSTNSSKTEKLAPIILKDHYSYTRSFFPDVSK